MMPRGGTSRYHGRLSRARRGCDCRACRHALRVQSRRVAYIRLAWGSRSRNEIALRLHLDAGMVTRIAKQLGLPPKVGGHTPRGECGTDAEWQRGCRCPRCVDAHRAYQRDYQARRKALASQLARAGRAATSHGSLARYDAGCDCPRCEAAHAKREADKHPHGPPRWRCACDPYRLNPGEATHCHGCGTPAPWADAEPQTRRQA